MGEIPSVNNFEKREKIGYCERNGIRAADYVLDDSALVYQSDIGLFIITGCSHSGVCNILDYAKKICKDNRVIGVIGGFHLFEVNHKLHETIDFFKKNNIDEIYPCHCISLKAKIEMGKNLNINEVGVGLEINI